MARRAHPGVQRALVAALEASDTATLERLVPVLIQSGGPSSHRAVLRHWPGWPESLQRLVETRADRLQGAMAIALRDADPESTSNPTSALAAIALIHRTNRTELAWRVLQHLKRAAPVTRGPAAGCLIHLAQVREDPSFAVELLDDAAASYALHEHDEILFAALPYVRIGLPKFTAALAGGHGPTAGRLGQFCRIALAPEVVKELLAISRQPRMRMACRDGLEKIARRGDLADALQEGHLLALEDVRRTVRRALVEPTERLERGPRKPIASDADDTTTTSAEETPKPRVALMDQVLAAPALLDWPASAQRALPALIATTSGDGIAGAHERSRRLSTLTATDLTTRWLALGRLMQSAALRATDDTDREHHPNARQRAEGHRIHARALEAFAHDADARLAQTAVRTLLHRDALLRQRDPEAAALVNAPALSGLINSSHASIRDQARSDVAEKIMTKTWDQWDQWTPTQRRKAGHGLLQLYDALPQHLGRRLAERHPPTRQRALAMIAAWALGDLFADALIAILADPATNPRAAASAAAALATADTPHTRDALANAQRHEDSRVRANAIEAAPPTTIDAALCADEANRPRANAVAALLDAHHDSAMDQLDAMLEDQRPRHRASALWVSASRQIVEVAPRVADLAAADPDSGVRRRAVRAFKDLLGSLEGPVQTNTDSVSPPKTATAVTKPTAPTALESTEVAA